MREIVVERGMDAGTHRVYTVEEARGEGVTTLPDWRKAEKGDWIETDDGYVLQCLNAGSLTEMPVGSRWVRTAIGTYRTRKWDRLDTEHRESRGTFTGRKYTAAGTQIGPVTAREKLFVELWFALNDSALAYRQAFEGADYTRSSVRVAVRKLLKRRRVIEYMKEYLGDVLLKHEIDQDYVIRNIKGIADTEYDPEKGHNILPTKLRANVLLGTLVDVFETLTGGKVGTRLPSGRSAEISDAEFEQIEGDVSETDGKSLSDGEAKALPSGD